TDNEFYGSLRELLHRANTEEGYLEYLKEDVDKLIKDYEEEKEA
ncbi:unnamed protein product, partial [marine sediment metagenome]